jgi:hypothetical protein
MNKITKIGLTLLSIFFAYQVNAITIDYVNSTDVSCGGDGEINFQISDLAYGEAFEYSLDGGANWSTETHDVMYSVSGYTVYNLEAGNYYFRVREQGSGSYVNFSGNPVVIITDAPDFPVITSVSSGTPSDCNSTTNLFVTALYATHYSIDGGENWQTSNQFTVNAGEYPKNRIMAKNQCDNITIYDTDGYYRVKTQDQLEVESWDIGTGADNPADLEFDYDDPSCSSCPDAYVYAIGFYNQYFSVYDVEWSINGNNFVDIETGIGDVPAGMYYVTFRIDDCDYIHPTPLLIGGSLTINIPDTYLKAALISNSSLNINSDTEIQVSEAVNFSGSIDLNNADISDLTGLEWFENITELIIDGLSISSVDLNTFTNVETLEIRNLPDVTSLSISNNTSVETLVITNTSITSLDVTNNIFISNLWLSNNLLESVDLSMLNSLDILDLEGNYLIDVNLGSQMPSGLNVTNNPFLSCLHVYDIDYAEFNYAYDANTSLTEGMCLSANAFLNEISVNGVMLQEFDQYIFNYTVGYAYCETIDMNVTGTVDDTNAGLNIETASSSNNYIASLTVTAEDGTSQLTYTVQFNASPEIVINDVLVTNPICPNGVDYGTISVDATGGTGTLEFGVANSTHQWWIAVGETETFGAGKFQISVRDELGCVELYNNGDSVSIVDPIYSQQIVAHTNISSAGANDGTITCSASFEGATSVEYRLLKWNATDEYWEAIGAAQTSSVFTDLEPGIYSFRFEALPMNCVVWGGSSLEDREYVVLQLSTSIEQKRNTEAIVIYPNPAQNQISMKGLEIGTKYSLVDVSGRVLIQSQADTKVTQIDLHDLTNGIYFIRIQNSANKIVVER